TVSPAVTHTYVLTAIGASGTTAATAATTVTVAGPPSPPPPPPGTGTRTVTATAVPYTGPAWVLGVAKHLDFARLGGRWYKAAGDHPQLDGNTFGMPTAFPVSLQGGRQEILSFSAAANDWREDTPYYLPAS